MAPKRSSDASELDGLASSSSSLKENDAPAPPLAKKPRLSAESTSEAKGKGKKAAAPTRWQDVQLEEDPELERVLVFDDCAEVRRKIRLLQKTPGWKITQWLRDIGGINSNSYGRFMKEKGKTDGATNGTYTAAYEYFEKVRIAEGKKKTAGRVSNEENLPKGFPLENRRYGWFPKGK